MGRGKTLFFEEWFDGEAHYVSMYTEDGCVMVDSDMFDSPRLGRAYSRYSDLVAEVREFDYDDWRSVAAARYPELGL